MHEQQRRPRPLFDHVHAVAGDFDGAAREAASDVGERVGLVRRHEGAPGEAGAEERERHGERDERDAAQPLHRRLPSSVLECSFGSPQITIRPPRL